MNKNFDLILKYLETELGSFSHPRDVRGFYYKEINKNNIREEYNLWKERNKISIGYYFDWHTFDPFYIEINEKDWHENVKNLSSLKRVLDSISKKRLKYINKIKKYKIKYI
jgi:hypothetical protein